jgi:hypothetical protein
MRHALAFVGVVFLPVRAARAVGCGVVGSAPPSGSGVGVVGSASFVP